MQSNMKWEHNILINELTHGMELAKQLKLHLGEESSHERRESLIQMLVSSYDKALLILNCCSSSVSQPQTLQPAVIVSDTRSDASKKRKLMPRWTDQVRIDSEIGLEGPGEDGYVWRKYGQKDIQGRKYPRSYYRCTYRSIKDCLATKQIQRSNEDPSLFDIVYRGTHSCRHVSHLNPQLSTQEAKHNNNNNHETNHLQNQSNDMLMYFKNGLRLNNENPDNNPLDGFSQMTNFGGGHEKAQHGDCDLSAVISANASDASSSTLYFDFSPDEACNDQNFPFGTLGFFP